MRSRVSAVRSARRSAIRRTPCSPEETLTSLGSSVPAWSSAKDLLQLAPAQRHGRPRAKGAPKLFLRGPAIALGHRFAAPVEAPAGGGVALRQSMDARGARAGRQIGKMAQR